MIRNKFLDTTHLKLFVVDEADQMLDRGFVENIKEIL
jgi:superfamily II DNA/RNA helicase